MHKYLFILCPPFSGSTVLHGLLATSPHVSALPREGQFIPAVRHIMLPDRLNPDKQIPWSVVRRVWEGEWDMAKPVLLEKSPANVLRAREIEETFDPAYFVCMIRDPYAFCEGRNRRDGLGMAEAARLWLYFGGYQRQNIENLQRTLSMTYEAFTEDPSAVVGRLLAWMPELEELDAGRSFRARTVAGSRVNALQNFNADKMARLKAQHVEEINAVLAPHADLMHFFGYAYRAPDQFPRATLRDKVWDHAHGIKARLRRRIVSEVRQRRHR